MFNRKNTTQSLIKDTKNKMMAKFEELTQRYNSTSNPIGVIEAENILLELIKVSVIERLLLPEILSDKELFNMEGSLKEIEILESKLNELESELIGCKQKYEFDYSLYKTAIEDYYQQELLRGDTENVKVEFDLFEEVENHEVCNV